MLSRDLMVRSRVEAGLGEASVKVEMITGEEVPGGFDLLLVDLNREHERRLAWLGRATA